MKVQVNIRNSYMLLGDIILLVVCVFLGYVLRLELGAALIQYSPSMYWMAAVAILIKPLVYYYFGLYRRLWQYASTHELRLIVVAVSSGSLVLALAMISLFSMDVFIGFPRSVLVIDWLLSLLAVGGLRFGSRLLAENRVLASVSAQGVPVRKVLVVGAGDAGALVVREMQKNPQLTMSPIGFLDDNAKKQQQTIYGLPVIGTLKDLARVLDSRRIDEVIIAIPSAPGKVVRLVADGCRLRGVTFRTMPGLYELLGGKVSINRLREVDITDLLRRAPARVEDSKVGTVLTGKVVMVTGAGGSIGRELCRQISRWGPSQLVLLGHGENSIFETMIDLQESFPGLAAQPVIADIRDLPRMRDIFHHFHPQVVFHTAAHKHVPLMEMNVEEAVTNNVMGTANVVRVANENNVEQLVLISTDKAIRPRNVMGATKRIAEQIVLDSASPRRQYSVVRFGNVLGSRGSVIPLFKHQISRGGPITITHPDMKRYFMTIPEAVYLVLQSATLGEGGETFVLNMGEQVRIVDLAEDLIRLSGLEPGKDIEIVYTGIRPGEKLSEDLWDEGHIFQPTIHPDIYRLECQENLTGEVLEKTINELVRLAQEGDRKSIVQMLSEVIPGAEVLSTPPPEIGAIE
jgi:FlaA1/EpsC-like NDP-sugar epimerase